jgi:cytochrome c-type biogenesis protein CcmH/NrfG
MLMYILKSHNTEEYTKTAAKRQFSNAQKTRAHTEVSTSTEFCTQLRRDLHYGPSDRAKWILQQSGLDLL